jgi:hypothetical protein
MGTSDLIPAILHRDGTRKRRGGNAFTCRPRGGILGPLPFSPRDYRQF